MISRDIPNMEKIDFRNQFSWRIFRIMSEFIEGFQFLADLNKEVTIFGSARFKSNNPHYKEARQLGKILGKAGFTVITGGGPGIMEAANRGAFEAKAPSVGLNIQLQKEQRVNKYVTKSIGFYYFFTRKVMLSFASQAYVYFPGGFGTLDEFFELVTLIQTKKISSDIPVIMIGKDFWSPLVEYIKNNVYGKHRAVNIKDLKIFHLVETAEEAYEIIKKTHDNKNS